MITKQWDVDIEKNLTECIEIEVEGELILVERRIKNVEKEICKRSGKAEGLENQARAAS